jgi:hypothetical protein
MKKIISVLTVLMLLASPCFGAWDYTAPAGSSAAADIDTNVIANNTAIQSATEDMRGWVNLKVVRDSATQVTVTADQLWLQKATDLPRNFSTVSEAIAITTSGASGLDTGAEADVWYYIWIIAKDDNTINGLLSASATAPSMPSGYTYKTLVSAVHNTSGDLVNFTQEGRIYSYGPGIAISSGEALPWTAIDLSAYVPSSISTIAFGVTHVTTGNTSVSNINTESTTLGNPTTNKVFINTSSNAQLYWRFQILTANTIYVGTSAGAAANATYIGGFEINKLN